MGTFEESCRRRGASVGLYAYKSGFGVLCSWDSVIFVVFLRYNIRTKKITSCEIRTPDLENMRVPSLFACLPGLSPQSLFQSTDKPHSLWGITEKPLPPPPPSVEVLPSKDAQFDKYVAEPVNLQGGLILLKSRVNTTDVFGVPNLDLVPGKYEGGLKLWESSLDLVNTLKREIQDGQLSFRGKRVLELGCGNGLPGIFACLKGASTVHFQDFNAEVLRCLTIPNVYVNLQNARERLGRHCDGPVTPTRTTTLSPDVHFYAGDWGDMHTLLSVVGQDHLGACDINLNFSEDDLFLDRSLSNNSSGVNQETQIDSSHGQQITRTRKLSGSRACERANDMDPSEGGYDIILMAETVYSLVSMRKLYGLIKKCLRPPYGVVYLAAKKHSFCGGGGTRQFRSLVEEDGILGAHLVVEVADSSSNIREIWKFFYK